MRRTLPIKPAIAVSGRWLWWLVAALLFGQSFGALHRIVHTRGGPTVIGAAAPAAEGYAAQPGGSRWAHWFGSHGASDCALIDHALQPTPPATPALAPAAVVVAAAPPAALVGTAPAGSASFFEARAPPSPPVRTSLL